MTGPYAQAAGDYWSAGWRGVLPLPPRRKKEPPAGYTGWDGADPSYPDVLAWTEDRGDGNVALHLPDGVLGIDVDQYDGKVGGDTLARLEASWGPLPPTWRTTSRDNISGIRLFRVPTAENGASLAWPSKPGPGIETVHRGHRYMVVPPSIHPDTGRAYRWITPDGVISTVAPRITELPELPMTWVIGLTQGREAHTYQGAGMNDEEIRSWLESLDRGDGPCQPMDEAIEEALTELRSGGHDALRMLMRIVGLAAGGHDGFYHALREFRTAFAAEVRLRRGSDEEVAEEWQRSLFGAADKIAGEMVKTGTETCHVDPCELFIIDPPQLETFTESSPAVDSLVDEEVPPVPEDDGKQGTEPSVDDEPRILTPEERRAMAVEREYQNLAIRKQATQRLQAEDAPAFRALSFTDFKLGPEPEPIVPGLLYRDSLSRIFGAPGCGKSFLALDLAFCVALGKDWAGEHVEQAKVAYVMAEGQRVNKLRAEAWQERHGITDDELEDNFYAVPDALALTEAAIGPFVAWIKAERVGLVVLDTKNAMQVGEENSATDAAIMRRALDAIRKATDACVVLIDHTGKHDGEEARGSSAVKAAMDTEVKVENDGGSPAKVTVTVSRDKAAEAGRQWEFMLRMAARAAVLVVKGDDVSLPEPRPLPGEVERKWQAAELFIPEAVLDYAGLGKAAVPDLARFMAHDAGVADPDGIGVTQAEAKTALSTKTLGPTAGHSAAAVRRAWSALRGMGYLAPADGKDGSDGKAENTTGRHVWTARNGLR